MEGVRLKNFEIQVKNHLTRLSQMNDKSQVTWSLVTLYHVCAMCMATVLHYSYEIWEHLLNYPSSWAIGRWAWRFTGKLWAMRPVIFRREIGMIINAVLLLWSPLTFWSFPTWFYLANKFFLWPLIKTLLLIPFSKLPMEIDFWRNGTKFYKKTESIHKNLQSPNSQNFEKIAVLSKDFILILIWRPRRVSTSTVNFFLIGLSCALERKFSHWLMETNLNLKNSWFREKSMQKLDLLPAPQSGLATKYSTCKIYFS